MIFRDRQEAGRLLADRLGHLRGQSPIVLALPRGGATVGREIARALDAPLDLLFVRKIGAPGQPELALGAVTEHAPPVLNRTLIEELGISPALLEREAARQREEIARRRFLYLGDRPRQPRRDRTLIVTDDGIATGATVRAACAALREAGPRRLVLAAPVAPAEVARTLAQEVDDLILLQAPDEFDALGLFYYDFHQLDDAEVIALLDPG